MEIDRIQFYVMDATQARDILIDRMGLKALGDIVNEHTIEYLVGNANLLFSFSSPLNSASPVANYLELHPSGVKGISFRVDDLDEMRRKIDRLGVEIISASADGDEPSWIEIRGWGAIEHTLIQSRSLSIDPSEPIMAIDHLVLNVPVGELEPAATWYENVFGFKLQQTFDIQTSRSGLTSVALVSDCGKVRFNINQPSSNNSQIQQFLDANRGAGIQHIALQTNQIVREVDRMQQQGLTFLSIPAIYYIESQIRARTEHNLSLTDGEWQDLERLQILADWSKSTPEEILLQIFTEPIFEQPTFFFEVIERRNRAKGFGQGNFQALFEAIEQHNNFPKIPV